MATLTRTKKYRKLSASLREMVLPEGRAHSPSRRTPVSNWLIHTMRHCNAGRTIDAALALQKHCEGGGRIFVTMAGAGSSFEMGTMLAPMIEAGLIAGISVTAANLEESLYRLIANGYYGWIPNYEKLTPEQEKELERAGFRRITDTFLPEDESVRMILGDFLENMRRAQAEGKRYHWSEFFTMLLENRQISVSSTGKEAKESWLYQAWLSGVPVFVPGPEDSTMGNIVASATYDGAHAFLKKYKIDGGAVDPRVVKTGFEEMHRLAEWYLDATQKHGLAFLQLGGGIAADFPICVVPHLKKDYLEKLSAKRQEALIRPWAMFIEIIDAHMSFGSYSGAGGDEKITWSKLNPDSTRIKIDADYTLVLPILSAILLDK